MSEHEGPKTLPQAGEPGTIAVDVGEPKGKPHVTYHADQSGAPPKLRVQNLSVTYIDRKGNRTEAVRDVSFDVYDKPDAGEIVVFLGTVGLWQVDNPESGCRSVAADGRRSAG